MTDTAAHKSSRPLISPMLIRQAHVVISMFVAPSLLMFSATGAVQIFRLHESHPGYTPLPIVEKLGRVHRDQVYAMRPPRPQRPAAARPAAPAAAAPKEEATPISKLLLQWFFCAISIALVISTALGIWMGLTVTRWKMASRIALIAGAVLPVLILLL
ncbi:hypothetical protein GVN24_30445 [Rhizobium sp. CRIBSB]|nr:hypothetical protein [Rhizobium sp. CRIBSB]